MKKMLLSALLILSPAAAQATIPATPAPAPEQPVPPVTAPPAPTTPAPVTPAPVTPAPVSPTSPIFRISAPVGAAVELSVTTTSRTSVTNVQVTALPGSKVTEAELNRIRRDLSSALGQTSENTVIPGKAFFKVTGRNASGSISLLTTVVQNIPQQKPMTLRITQTIAPDGKISGLKIDSPDPVISAMFAKLSVENLERLAGESGSNFTGVYGQPLKVSEPRQMTVSVDSQELMTSLFGAIASAANADDLIGQVQANPLTVTTTTTYQGLNAQGLHAFKQTSKYGDWKIDLSGSGDMPAIAAQLLKADTTGSQTYRKDGLPGASSQNVKMTMSMSMALDGVQVKMTMNLDQTVTMTPK